MTESSGCVSATYEGRVRHGSSGQLLPNTQARIKGFQVAPAELEALLYTHPGLVEAAVIGRKDERSGEVPVAYVVARGPIDREAVINWVAERVPDYKRLVDVILCDAIPKTPSGKILRRMLRQQDARIASGTS